MWVSRSWIFFLVLLEVMALMKLTSSKVYPKEINRKTPKNRRIWGGMDSNTGQNFGGWLIRIIDSKGEFMCGGAYYSPLLVITSANCIYPYRNSLQGVSAESTAFSKCDREIYAEIDTIHFPKKFVHNKRFMDVALVRLKAPLKGRLTEFITLCNTSLVPEQGLMVFGWGYDSMEVQKPSTNPRNGLVTLMAMKTCRQTFGKETILASTSICIKQPRNPRECIYDGGCPLIYKNQLCGVVSIGSQCQNTSYPGIYTNLYEKQVMDFIKQTEEDIEAGKIWRSPVKPRHYWDNEETQTEVKYDVQSKLITPDPLEAMVC
ncbi:seminase [Drosophila ananassae]|nr:seminase [Drosophila ananassae]